MEARRCLPKLRGSTTGGASPAVMFVTPDRERGIAFVEGGGEV